MSNINDPFLTGLYKYIHNSYDLCVESACLFCDRSKCNVSSSSKELFLHNGCNPYRTTDQQKETLADVYKLERGYLNDTPGGILFDFISKINDDFQDAIEKLAAQSKDNIFSATTQFDTAECQAFRRSHLNYENPLSTVFNIFREALDRKERNNSVTVFGIPGDLPQIEIDQMFDRICNALQINYRINVNLEKIKNMLIYKFCCRRHRDHFFYNFQEFRLTGNSIGLVSNANLYCFENMASKMYNLSREIHEKLQRREIKKYLRHQGLIYVWSNNNNNLRHPKLFYFIEELNVRKDNVIRLLNSKIIFSKIVENFFPEKVHSIVNMRYSKFIQNYLHPEMCFKYHPVSSIVDFLDQEEKHRTIEIFRYFHISDVLTIHKF